jgi:hypothetical protein
MSSMKNKILTKCSQFNGVQTIAQVNKHKTREQPKKEKVKVNAPKTAKQQPVVNQVKTPLQMNYNLVDEISKL